ncbi:MAG: hypothetical protein ACHQQ3_08305 [Gemmatimonadales bacterium]
MRFNGLIIASALLVACQRTETPQEVDARIDAESKAVRAELDAKSATLARFESAGAFDSAATLLTTDHHSMPPNTPAMSGRENWLKFTNGLKATGTFNITTTTESVIANGPIAVQTGHAVLAFTPGPGAPKGAKASTDTVKYMWQWRKVNGSWLIAQATWNSDLTPKP